MSIPIDRLVRRVEVIVNECAPEPVDSEGNVIKQDEFTKKKKDISQHIKAVRTVASPRAWVQTPARPRTHTLRRRVCCTSAHRN
jgi:hypothetical protein